MLELEEKGNKLNQEGKEREAQNEHEKIKLIDEQQQNEKAIIEQRRVDQKVLRLAEGYKKEMLQRKIVELEKKLDAKLQNEWEMVVEKLIVNSVVPFLEEMWAYMASLSQTMTQQEFQPSPPPPFVPSQTPPLFVPLQTPPPSSEHHAGPSNDGNDSIYRDFSTL
ncbi:hypothetical protein OROMI_021038 [Orobanche minor]